MISRELKFKRDLRVDFFRGLALMTIFINHIPQNRWAAITHQNYGFSDAAELFVALAGFSAVLAYGRYFDRGAFGEGGQSIAARIGTIYFYHIATMVVVGVVLILVARALENPELLASMKFDHIAAGDWRAIFGVLALVTQPTYFDILPLYVVLLSVFPLLYMLVRRCLPCALAISGLMWLITQFAPAFNLPSVDGQGWYFNPFAWQFLLLLGMAAAVQVKRGGPYRSKLLVSLAIAVLVVSLILRAPWNNWPFHLGSAPSDLGSMSLLASKTTLGPLRLMHIVALGYLLMVLVPPRAAWLKSPAARLISNAGRNSLEVFCLGVALSVVVGLVITVVGRGVLVESLVMTLGLAALLAAGTSLARQLHQRNRTRDKPRVLATLPSSHSNGRRMNYATD